MHGQTERRIRKALSHVSDTKEFVVGEGMLSLIPTLCRRHFSGGKYLLVADANTFSAAGETVSRILGEAGIDAADPWIFPADPVLSPDYANVAALRDRLAESGAIAVAVGSGTLNDIAKRASHEANRGYMIVGTAASMDGYSSFGAALLRDGFKQTMECPAPRVIVADVSVLRRAPREMTAAGYGDLLGKLTAGADWIAAHVLEAESIDPLSWNMAQKRLHRWIGRPEKLLRDSSRAFGALFEGLIMTGFAMQALQSSRPASGTEHLFSHVWEMRHLEHHGIPVSHGFKVSLGTLAAAALMESLFEKDLTRRDVEAACSVWPDAAAREREVREALKGTSIVDQAVAMSLEKHAGGETLRERLTRAAGRWDVLRRRIAKQLPPFEKIRGMLESAGCPVRPEQIGLSREQLRETYRPAQMIRPRYTILDLAYESGRLDSCLDRIFSTSRFFP